METEWVAMLLVGPLHLLASLFGNMPLLLGVLAIGAFFVFLFFHEVVFEDSRKWRRMRSLTSTLVIVLSAYLWIGVLMLDKFL